MSERISRSEQKRQHKQIEDAARELAALSPHELKRLPGSDELKSEIAALRTTKGGARKRQIKYIAKIMKREPHDEILQFLQQEKGSRIEENRFSHEIEKLRDNVITEALEAYDESRRCQEPWDINYESRMIRQVVETYPLIDELEVRRSAHQYARTRNKVHYRELYRLIKAAAEKKRLSDSLFEKK